MNLEYLFYCALSGGLLAYGVGCSDDVSASLSSPVLPAFDDYSVTQMTGNRTQVYGSTAYDFVVECDTSILEIHHSSSAEAVWFDDQIHSNERNTLQKNVTITPGQDDNWSAKVIFKCVDGDLESSSTIANFCYNGPCSDTDKP